MTANPLTTIEIAQAIRVGCPYCKATASVPCHGRSPDTRRTPHPERVAAGKANAEVDEVLGLSDPPPIDREEVHRAITGIRESLENAPAHGPARSNIVRRLLILEDKLAGGHGRISL